MTNFYTYPEPTPSRMIREIADPIPFTRLPSCVEAEDIRAERFDNYRTAGATLTCILLRWGSHPPGPARLPAECIPFR